MTTLQKTSRATFVRQRHSSKSQPVRNSSRTEQTSRKAYHPASIYLPVEPRPMARRNTGRTAANSSHKGYDIAFSLGQTKVHAPTLTLPQLGPRWVSLALTLCLGFLLYIIWTASPFTVFAAEVLGSHRLSASEINSVLDLNGQPVFKFIPSQIEANLHTAFPDLESVHVQVLFPNRVVVEVVERTPVVAWYLNNAVTWIDASGMAFTPRGNVPGLVQVSAYGNPPLVPQDPAVPVQEQKFIATDLVQAFLALAPDVPSGMPMIFDPVYGMGWQDPRGWTVYFGQNAKDIPLKKMAYIAILDALTLKGVQPSLISVEYLNAPFYK
jgi:cell division protein FtsQ